MIGVDFWVPPSVLASFCCGKAKCVPTARTPRTVKPIRTGQRRPVPVRFMFIPVPCTEPVEEEVTHRPPGPSQLRLVIIVRLEGGTDHPAGFGSTPNLRSPAVV